MHEIGIADAMIKMADRILEGERVSVRSITVEVGSLSGVVPRYLADCWGAVAAGTRYEDTRLLIHPVPATARCEDCKNIFVANVEDLHCPQCGRDRLTPLTGQDLCIAEIEVAEEE